MKRFLIGFLAVVSIAICPLAFGQVPDAEHSLGIAYISGGVGEGEAAAMLVEAKAWPLMLELSQLEGGRGAWIFGAQIQILSNKKVVFDARADGPYILINLDPGVYAIQASYQDVEQHKVVSIKAGQSQKIAIFWK